MISGAAEILIHEYKKNSLKKERILKKKNLNCS